MAKSETRVEVELVERVSGKIKGPALSARVWGVEKSQSTEDTIRIDITYDAGGGTAMKQVVVNKKCLSIVKITIFDDQYPEGFSDEYTLEESSQWEACSDLLRVFADPDFAQMRGEPNVSKFGPRRIEVVLQKVAASVQLKDKVLVMGMHDRLGINPIHRFTGKAIYTSGTMAINSAQYDSKQYFVSQIDHIPAGGVGSLTKYFEPIRADISWQELERLFKTFSSTEKLAMENWSGRTAPRKVYDDPYAWAGQGSNHWTKGGRNFQRPKAHYRLAGDKQGIALLKEQKGDESSSIILLTPDQSRAAVLDDKGEAEKPEKKTEAGAGDTSPGSLCPQIHASSGGCSKCGGTTCTGTQCKGWPRIPAAIPNKSGKPTYH